MPKLKQRLPVTGKPILPPIDYVKNKENADRERRYKAKEALETMNRAAEIKKDKGLLKEVKALAREQLKSVR